jgi:hypothetical protein
VTPWHEQAKAAGDPERTRSALNERTHAEAAHLAAQSTLIKATEALEWQIECRRIRIGCEKYGIEYPSDEHASEAPLDDGGSRKDK